MKTLTADKIYARNRAASPIGPHRPGSRPPSAYAVGDAEHWIRKVARKKEHDKALAAIPLHKLVGECPAIQVVLARGAGVRTVLDLARLPQEKINSISGLGPKRRKEIFDYLVSKHVVLTWRA